MPGREDEDVGSSTQINICRAGLFRDLRVEVVEPCGLDADIWTPMQTRVLRVPLTPSRGDSRLNATDSRLLRLVQEHCNALQSVHRHEASSLAVATKDTFEPLLAAVKEAKDQEPQMRLHTIDLSMHNLDEAFGRWWSQITRIPHDVLMLKNDVRVLKVESTQ